MMVANGPEKCRAFGRWLGDRYKRFDNLLWMSGNDFYWKKPQDDEAVFALASGIAERDPRHLQTIELQPRLSGSLDDPRWAPLISLCASYTYYPTYAQVLKDYNRPVLSGAERPNAIPVFMVESDYEFERDATPAILRRQEYWSLLSGACGQLYGNGYTWPFKSGWKEKLDTPGAIQMKYVQALFEPRRWWELVPDQKHKLVTAGYGTFDGSATDGNCFVMTSDYVTAARTNDGKLAMAYLPSRRTITVDLARLSGPRNARWYDPSRGEFVEAENGKVANSGKHAFRPPGNNSDGDGDWVLVMEVD